MIIFYVFHWSMLAFSFINFVLIDHVLLLCFVGLETIYSMSLFYGYS